MQNESFVFYAGDASDAYQGWDQPDCIISDGPYGLGLYPGEPNNVKDMLEQYKPHILSWSRFAKPSTTLWFWNTEVGWATVHPMLIENGWKYETCHVWDKGVGHIAGNVNGQSIRRFPAVTEICVFYSRKPVITKEKIETKVWLRSEWLRSGLPLAKANEACSVANVATRKYLTLDYTWYFPPGEAVVKMAEYASKFGKRTDKPYFSIDGVEISEELWNSLRYTWNHQHGLTNVWTVPALRGVERVKIKGKAVHVNQKPLTLMKQIIQSCTNESSVIWEPFGGLCSASVAAIQLKRKPFAAEILPEYQSEALKRLNESVKLI